MPEFVATTINLGRHLAQNVKEAIGGVGSPKKRGDAINAIHEFALARPKLATFLLANLILTGLPLLAFLIFSAAVFLTTLVTLTLTAVISATLLTVFIVGLSLLLLIPAVTVTSFLAFCVYVSVLVGYLTLKWMNQGEHPAAPGTVMGDKLNDVSGGRLVAWLEGPKTERERDREERHGGVMTPRRVGNGNGWESFLDEKSGGSERKASGIPVRANGTNGTNGINGGLNSNPNTYHAITNGI